MKNVDFFAALDDLERDKRISRQIFLDALEQAMAIAYKKHFGVAKGIEIRLNPDNSNIRIFAYQNVVEDSEEIEDEEIVDEIKQKRAINEIPLSEARLIKKSAKVGDVISEEVISKKFGRIAAQTARQVLTQKLREVENSIAFDEISQKEEQLITCIIRRKEADNFFVEINKIEAILAKNDQMPHDRTTLKVGDKVKVFVKKIKEGQRGPQVAVSRTSTGFVKRLFEIEVPEIASGLVVIKNIVRDAGYRTKIAVYSDEPSIDPVGACVGNRGMRVNSIVSELNGEKIDIIPWCSDPLEFIARSLSPARVLVVHVNDDDKSAKVVVADDKLSLAIGKGGQNVRLAVKLTGWKIDVKSYSASLQLAEESQIDDETDVFTQNEELEIEDFGDIDFGEISLGDNLDE